MNFANCPWDSPISSPNDNCSYSKNQSPLYQVQHLSQAFYKLKGKSVGLLELSSPSSSLLGTFVFYINIIIGISIQNYIYFLASTPSLINYIIFMNLKNKKFFFLIKKSIQIKSNNLFASTPLNFSLRANFIGP